ncbi:hypothetical protein BDV38DRAFT_141723 [Aspergillus pseudotamarii]|uniref:Uncharacterized protein n=1 Tax=Aspergillus pseudotamarii TaxID=132259 RepID=A0A5N6SQ54_ASPPS|nr:uncharacterized protein BDV38DRAFT_141723 [Aspergillus pseudotamarii]KAE8135244.1 hypothetical protein BDV38DRAFT_141723 [Aspergillus pseudotamarii]
MAALTITPTTVRQPFASLDAPRVRPLLKSKMNLKNQQNGAILSGKRQPLSEVDTENIDPTIFNSSTKRKRGSDEDEHESVKNITKPMKTSRITLTTVKSNTAPRIPTTPPKASLSAPKSAPTLKPAGRSPPAKPCRPFARRSTIAKSRPEPASKKSVNRPFSLAAALASGKPTSQPATKAPSGWSFDIYVDSEQEEMTNLMQHSTCVLDISDDEGKGESITRGKENIPPAELGIDLPRSRQRESPAAAARKSGMMEEPRAPLGDLDAADYYGEDCHAFSYAIVYDDEETDATPAKKTLLPTLPRSGRHSRSKLSSVSSISSLLEATTPVKQVEDAKSRPSEAEIEVWESGSAVEESP